MGQSMMKLSSNFKVKGDVKIICALCKFIYQTTVLIFEYVDYISGGHLGGEFTLLTVKSHTSYDVCIKPP